MLEKPLYASSWNYANPINGNEANQEVNNLYKLINKLIKENETLSDRIKKLEDKQ